MKFRKTTEKKDKDKQNQKRENKQRGKNQTHPIPDCKTKKNQEVWPRNKDISSRPASQSYTPSQGKSSTALEWICARDPKSLQNVTSLSLFCLTGDRRLNLLTTPSSTKGRKRKKLIRKANNIFLGNKRLTWMLRIIFWPSSSTYRITVSIRWCI